MVSRHDRQTIRTNLVGGIPVGGNAIGTNDDTIDQAEPKATRNRPIGNHVMRNAVLGQLPCRQAGALQQRSRLGHPDHRRQSLVVQSPYHAERRAISTRRQRTRVADCADPGIGSKERRTMPSNLLTAANLSRVERLRCPHDGAARYHRGCPLLCCPCQSGFHSD